MSYCQEWGKLSDASFNGKGANPSMIQVAEDVDLTLTTNTESLNHWSRVPNKLGVLSESFLLTTTTFLIFLTRDL
uniref:Uncharacterized protein n=1 Tax=Amphimedon queenslandica TaxID=400682 RepID=A0A1X7TQM1_AMPQE